ncbi:immunity protein Imm5 [Niabella pedocola]|uniref:Immunity protein Imm5 n=1 Tax=Niabella pedocola TaxID=1752077 RepID=A0ABS8PRS6_9BACT|nr:Imm5 family immunity protein [Niabella pedocola]MCD2422963.1 immunity protein Imm5 [Niabella pedocola]
MNNNLTTLKDQALAAISKDPKGALPVDIRNRIFGELDERSAALLLLRTLLFVRPLWNRTWPHDPYWDDLFTHIEAFTGGEYDATKLAARIRQAHTYMERRMEEEKLDAAYAGLALVYAGYEITSHNVQATAAEDEADSDPENWSALFVASLACNGGCADLTQIDPVRNRAFWNYFITGIDAAVQQLPLPPIAAAEPTATSEERPRKQFTLFLNGDERSTGELLQLYTQLMTDNGWKALKLESYYVNNKHSMTVFYQPDQSEAAWTKMDNMKLFSFNNKNEIRLKIGALRDAMYRCRPAEGAWYKMELLIEAGDAHAFSFFYDTQFPFFNSWADQLDFIKDFETYSRDEAFIPEWLKEILVFNQPR